MSVSGFGIWNLSISSPLFFTLHRKFLFLFGCISESFLVESYIANFIFNLQEEQAKRIFQHRCHCSTMVCTRGLLAEWLKLSPLSFPVASGI